jgi:hypothetical protein
MPSPAPPPPAILAHRDAGLFHNSRMSSSFVTSILIHQAASFVRGCRGLENRTLALVVNDEACMGARRRRSGLRIAARLERL